MLTNLATAKDDELEIREYLQRPRFLVCYESVSALDASIYVPCLLFCKQYALIGTTIDFNQIRYSYSDI